MIAPSMLHLLAVSWYCHIDLHWVRKRIVEVLNPLQIVMRPLAIGTI